MLSKKTANKKYIQNLVKEVMGLPSIMEPPEMTPGYVISKMKFQDVEPTIEERLLSTKKKYSQAIKKASFDTKYDAAAVDLVIKSGYDLSQSYQGEKSAKIPQKILDVNEKLKKLTVNKKNEQSADKSSIASIEKGLSMFSKATGLSGNELYRKAPLGKGYMSANDPRFSGAYAIWLYKNLLPSQYSGDMSQVIVKVLNLREKTLKNYQSSNILNLYYDIWLGEDDEEGEFVGDSAGGIKNNPEVLEYLYEIQLLEDSEFRNLLGWFSIAVIALLSIWTLPATIGLVKSLVIGLTVGTFLESLIDTAIGGEKDLRFVSIKPKEIIEELKSYVSTMKEKYENIKTDKIRQDDINNINRIMLDLNLSLIEKEFSKRKFDLDQSSANIGINTKDTVLDVINLISHKIEAYEKNYKEALDLEAKILTTFRRSLAKRFKSDLGARITTRLVKEDLDDILKKQKVEEFERSLKAYLGRNWFNTLDMVEKGYDQMISSPETSTKYKKGKPEIVNSIIKLRLHEKIWWPAYVDAVVKHAYEKLPPDIKKTTTQEEIREEAVGHFKNAFKKGFRKFFPLQDKDWKSYVTFVSPNNKVVILGLLSNNKIFASISKSKSGSSQVKGLASLGLKAIKLKTDPSTFKWEEAEAEKIFQFKPENRATLANLYRNKSADIRRLIEKYDDDENEEIKSKIITIKKYSDLLRNMRLALEAGLYSNEENLIKIGKYAWLLGLLDR